MSTITEPSGRQVLPPVADERVTTSAWAAHCAADADLRTRSKPHRDLAATLRVVASEPCAAASGACGRPSVHVATFLACEHGVPLCDRDAANLRARAEVGGTRCPSCGTKGATTWAPMGATS